MPSSAAAKNSLRSCSLLSTLTAKYRSENTARKNAIQVPRLGEEGQSVERCVVLRPGVVGIIRVLQEVVADGGAPSKEEHNEDGGEHRSEDQRLVYEDHGECVDLLHSVELELGL